MGPTKKILARALAESEDLDEEKRALDRNWSVYHEIDENQSSYGGFLPDASEVYGLSLRQGDSLRENFREFLDRINFLS